MKLCFRRGRINMSFIKTNKYLTSSIIRKPGQVIPTIKYSTVEQLVIRITFERYADMKSLFTFLLTYSAITTPKQFMDMLKSRMNSIKNPPQVADEEELKLLEKTIQRPVRLR